MAISTTLPRFDRVARLYRLMEYLSFGPLLERCRFHHLSSFVAARPAPRRALILGDGDGRFLARLVAACPDLTADAIDASPAMLRLLRSRVAQQGGEARVTAICADVRSFPLPERNYDLIATHFFLDCLTEAETATLLARLRSHLVTGSRWVVSEFQIPCGSRSRVALARTLISGLYTAFRVLTGLRVRRIPPWRALLARSGLVCRASQTFLGGLLVTEVWQIPEATALTAGGSQQRMTLSIDLVTTPGSIPGIDPGPEPAPGPPAVPEPTPAPGPAPDPDPEPYPGPIPAPQPVTRTA